MKKKISDYIIISDVDGTLLPRNKPVPQRNIDALNRFVAKGGRFGIATGRSKELTEEFAKSLPVNAPCVLYNGGALYDYDKGEFLMQSFLPESAKGYLARIRKDLPWLSVMVITGGNYCHVVDDEIPFATFSEEQREHYRNARVEELTGLWYKVLFSVTPEENKMLADYVKDIAFTDVRFVFSSDLLIEMLPVTSTKGFALQKLVELGHFPHESIVAIGDYYNDLEMIEFAAIGATTAEAPDDVKAAADFITGNCESGAVADLVEYLESLCD